MIHDGISGNQRVTNFVDKNHISPREFSYSARDRGAIIEIGVNNHPINCTDGWAFECIMEMTLS
jgi:hypothetical protein